MGDTAPILIILAIFAASLLYLDDHMRGIRVALTTNAAQEWGGR